MKQILRKSNILGFVFILIVIAFTFKLSHCLAQGEIKIEKAKKHFDEGVRLYQSGVFSLALEEFKKSYKVRPHWELHYNIGLCYYMMGDYLNAKREFDTYLEEGKENVKPEIAKQIQEVLQNIMTMICEILLEIDVEGAAIRIDGAEIGFSPMSSPIEVKPGEHLIEIVKEGYLPYRNLFVADKGEKRTLIVKLQKYEISKPEKEKQTVENRTVWPYYTGIGFGIVFAAASLGTGILTLQKKQEYNEAKTDYLKLYNKGIATESDYLIAKNKMDDIAKEGKILGTLTTVFLTTGVVLEVVSVTLYLLIGRKKVETKSSTGVLIPSVYFEGEKRGYLELTTYF